MALRLQEALNSVEIIDQDTLYADQVSTVTIRKFVSTYETLRSRLYEMNKASTLIPVITSFESPVRNYFLKAKLNELRLSSGQMTAYLEAKLEALPEKVKELEKQLAVVEKENKVLFESLNKFIQAEDFKVEPEKLRSFPIEVQSSLHEALGIYKNGFYIACCSMCGNILESLVKGTCQRNNLEYEKLAQGIDVLKDAGIIKKPYEQLIDVAKYYRDHADHPTSEAFTEEKAKLFLSSLIIFIEGIFA